MSKKLISGLQALIPFVLALLVIYYLYRDIEIEVILEALLGTDALWFSAAITIGLLGYWLRAWRWKNLLATNETIAIRTFPVFWAMMFGYVVNLIFPRAGEVARCGAIIKSYPINFGKIFGTVVLERTIDMFFMLFIIALAFLLEGAIFIEIFERLISLETIKALLADYFYMVVLLFLALALSVVMLYLKFKKTAWIGKIRHFARQFVSGLETLIQMENKAGFWLASILIWIIYFLMMYWMALSIPATHTLSATSVLMVLVMGSIGMIVPVQGGIGTFHAMVAFILLFYGVSEEQGKVFAILVHTSQIMIVLILGGIGFLYLFGKKKVTLNQ